MFITSEYKTKFKSCQHRTVQFKSLNKAFGGRFYEDLEF